MRILVVDDEPAVRRSVRSALTLEGYEVRLASKGAEALDVLASERVDAIVLDLLMPGLDGLEVCRRLRADGDPTPVLMLTVRNLVSDRWPGSTPAPTTTSPNRSRSTSSSRACEPSCGELPERARSSASPI
jgi:DNA-binding response OmpR family regulator